MVLTKLDYSYLMNWTVIKLNDFMSILNRSKTGLVRPFNICNPNGPTIYIRLNVQNVLGGRSPPLAMELHDL